MDVPVNGATARYIITIAEGQAAKASNMTSFCPNNLYMSILRYVFISLFLFLYSVLDVGPLSEVLNPTVMRYFTCFHSCQM